MNSMNERMKSRVSDTCTPFDIFTTYFFLAAPKKIYTYNMVPEDQCVILLNYSKN